MIPLGLRCLLELLGTAALVYIGCGAMLSSGEVAAVTLGFGLVVGLMVVTIGPRSGAHINPAVTIGFAIDRQFSWGEVVPYVLSQMLGGLLGVLGLAVSFSAYSSGQLAVRADITGPNVALSEIAAPNVTALNDTAANVNSPNATSSDEEQPVSRLQAIGRATGTFPGGAKDRGPGTERENRFTGAFVAEVLHSVFLMGVILAIVHDAKEEGGKCALVIGSTVAALCAAGGAAQASMNPARTFWCNLFADRADTLLLYVVAPVLGAAISALAARFLRSRSLNSSSAAPEA